MLPKRQTWTTTAIVFALATAPASAAAAGDSDTGPAVQPNPDQQQVTEQPRPAPPRSTSNPAVQSNPDQQPAVSTAPTVIVRTGTPNSGFDWGDVGIGAAGAIGLSVIGLAAALGVSQRRRGPVERVGGHGQQTNAPTEATSRQPAVDQIATDSN